MKNKTVLFSVVGGLVIVAGLVIIILSSGGQESVAPQKAEDSRPAASNEGTIERLSGIALSDYDGRATTLADFSGKPLVLNSWATWCPFCRQELPDFARLQEELGDSAVVIAIDRAERVADAKKYTDQFGITEKMTFLMDFDDRFYRNIGGFSMPETLFVDSTGTIVFHKRGPMTLDEMRSLAATHLK